MIQRVLLAAILVLLVMCTIVAAEPKHVDGGWQRSDEMPQETPTAPPLETVTEPEEPGAAIDVWGYYGVVGVGAVFALAALWWWLRRDA
jgi:hypothetical protein